MKFRQRGYSLLEASIVLALLAGVVTFGLRVAGTVQQQRHAQTTVLAIQDVLKTVQGVYPDAALIGYPAGIQVAQAVVDHNRAPGPYDSTTGCFELEGTTTLCLSVADSGTGRGPELVLGYQQAVGGARAQTCRLVVDTLQPAAIRMEVGTDQPIDAQGYFLRGANWNDFWEDRCKNPIDIAIALR